MLGKKKKKKDVIVFFQKLLGTRPTLRAILGATSSISHANKYEESAVFFGMVIAKKVNCVCLCLCLCVCVWVYMAVVTMYVMWLIEMSKILYLKRWRFYDKDRKDMIDKICDPGLKFG